MRLRTLVLVSTLALGLLAAPLLAEAQQAGKVYRIGFLGDFPRMRPNYEVFRRGLRDLGYIEEQNIIIEWRLTGRKPDRLAEMATDLVRQKVDVIAACCPLAPGAAVKSTRTIPIVIVIGADRYVTNLRRPGGNITGLSSMAADLIGKQLQLFKEAVPSLSRVALLGVTDHPAYTRTVRQAERAARGLGLQLINIGVRNPAEFPAAFRRMVAEGVDGVLIQRSGLLIRNRARTAELAGEAALPTMYGPREGGAGRRRPYVVRDECRGVIPAGCDFRGQDPEGREASGIAGGAAEEVRFGHQSKNGQADRCHDSSRDPPAGDQSDQVSNSLCDQFITAQDALK